MITFVIFVMIIVLIFIGIIIANIVYYSTLTTGSNLSNGQSTSMLWISVIGLIILIILAVWIVFIMVKYWKKKPASKGRFSELLKLSKSSKDRYRDMYGISTEKVDMTNGPDDDVYLSPQQDMRSFIGSYNDDLDY